MIAIPVLSLFKDPHMEKDLYFTPSIECLQWEIDKLYPLLCKDEKMCEACRNDGWPYIIMDDVYTLCLARECGKLMAKIDHPCTVEALSTFIVILCENIDLYCKF
jgi:hypothetical protein